jgi:predicted enzyme related to lactoylglutathione lyase
MDASTTWYRSVFGLQDAGGFAADDGSWRIENLKSDQLFVELIRDERTVNVDRPLGFRKVGFRVPDVEAIADRVAEATGERPRVVAFEEQGIRILQLNDPDGNVIQLSSPLRTTQ